MFDRFIKWLGTFLTPHSSQPNGPLLCPACQDDRWQEGPEGGSVYNIRCRNQHVYTYLPGAGIIDPDRYADQPELAIP